MRAARLLAILASLSAAPQALAADALKVELVPKAQKGQGSPELVVKAQAPLARLTLELKRGSDGKRSKQEAGPVNAGREHRFALPMTRVGEERFEGTLSVRFEDGQTGSMPISVAAELLAELSLTVAPGDVDLAAKTLAVAANRSLAKVQVALTSDTGTPLGTEEVEGPLEEGGKYRVGWKQGRGTVLRISVKGWDESGFFGGVDLFPWRVDIPHEEVHFRSGLSEIDPAELPKLEESFVQLQKAIAKYGALATIRLFIAGHTDTVGSAASNKGLSVERARAIGRWFHKRGVKIPIQYAGFGEELLLVQTPDETDEVRNRRAEYIVAVDPPAIRGQTSSWRPLD